MNNRTRPDRQQIAANFSHGFTLTELIVTILVVGILAAILWPISKHAIREAHYAEKIAEMNAASRGIYEWQLEHGGSFPLDEASGRQPGKSNPADYWPEGKDMDFDHWIVNPPGGKQAIVRGKRCRLVMITWFGENGRRDSPVHRAISPGRGVKRQADDVHLILELTCNVEGQVGPVRK